MRDQFEVLVVVQHGESFRFGRRSDQQVRDLSSPLTASGKQALHLLRTLDVVGGGLHDGENCERAKQSIPFIAVSRGVPDFEV